MRPIAFPSLVLRTVASCGALGAAAGGASFQWFGISLTAGVSALAVASTALLIHVRRLSAQLAARAIWGATGLLAALDLIVGPRTEQVQALGILVGVVIASVALGRGGLEPDERADGAFRPHAHRRPLLGVLGLGIADLASLSFFGLAHYEITHRISVAVPLALALAVSMLGIYRMRAWSVLTTAATAFGIGGLALAHALPVAPYLRPFYVASSALELVLLAPLLVGVFRALRVPREPDVVHLRVAATTHAPSLDSSSALAEIEAAAEAEIDDQARALPIRR